MPNILRRPFVAGIALLAFFMLAVSARQTEPISAAGQIIISEVNPGGSSAGYGADWIELTNTGTTAVDITGWKLDDNSNAFASAVALRGITSIPGGKSVVFFEGNATGTTDATIAAAFSTAWFGSPSLPAGFLIGAYGGSGVGLGGSGDQVNIFDSAGNRITGVNFGAQSGTATFDNAAGIGGTTNPPPTISSASVVGTNGAILSANGAETGSPGVRLNATPLTSIDLSTYVRVGRYDLPEPTRTTAPPGSLLAQEASSVTYDWDTDTLFVVGDGGTSVVQVTKTGELIDSMTLAAGASPQGTEFYDTEGITYVGGGKFVLVEERYRQVNLFTYVPGAILQRSDVKTVKLGTTIGNIGIEGITYDPLTSGYIAVKEMTPEGIFQTAIDFVAGTATNGSPTTDNPTNLFDPSLAGLLDFSDIFSLANLPSLSGKPDYNHLLIISQESGKVVNIDRSGSVSSSLTIQRDPGNPLSVADQTNEGVTMDGNGFLYIVNEQGGGDANHPQLWVYAHSSAANQAPTGIVLSDVVSSLPENVNTSSHVKLADVAVVDDGLGTNNLSVSGTDSGAFEIDSSGLYLKAGTVLDFETKPSYTISVNVDDLAVGASPDASTPYTLAVTDVVEAPPPSIVITEVNPSGSGTAAYGVDWFELTNTGATAIDITGWKVDDNSHAFATAVPLRGVTSIPAGKSAIFFEGTADGSTDATIIGKFSTAWFGTATPPAGILIGAYGGSGVGLSTTADEVTIFDSTGNLVTGVGFGASTTGFTFDNKAGTSGTTLPLPLISTLSAASVNGAFHAPDGETGSPGAITNAPQPTATITSGPTGPTNVTTPKFDFTTTNATKVECQIDAGDLVACPATSYTLSAQPEGGHIFTVKATGAPGTTPATATRAFTIDTTPPDTAFDMTPTDPSNGSAQFTFSDSNSTFECKLDGAAFVACTSPQKLTNLVDGSHTFQVRATDLAGNVDASPSTFTWTVDATPPDTTITAGPNGTTNTGNGSFSFSSEAKATFECSLDSATFETCGAGQNPSYSFSGLSNGAHTFAVRAIDAVGNIDPTPASRGWTVNDGTSPRTQILTFPAKTANSATATFTYTGTDRTTPLQFECRLDSTAASPWLACNTPAAAPNTFQATYNALAEGPHKFEVRAKDIGGNLDNSPSPKSWTVDVTKPLLTAVFTDTGTNAPYVPGTWAKSTVKLEVTCIDPGTAPSGVAHNHVKKSTTYGNGIETVGPLGVAPDDCMDKAGNTADPIGPWVVKVDTKAPSCDVSPSRIVVSPTGAMAAFSLSLTANDNLTAAYALAHATIVSVTGDNGSVAGDIGPSSITPAGVVSLQLNAIVGGPTKSRTYTAGFLVTDEAGNTNNCVTRVVVK